MTTDDKVGQTSGPIAPPPDARGRKAAIARAGQATGKSDADISWPSKGVDYYAYLDPSSSFATSFTQPTNWGNSSRTCNLDSPGTMQAGELEIADNDIGLFELTGQFTWAASSPAAQLATGYADIAPSTGNIGGSSMGDILSTQPIFGDGWTISYGFYDSGPGLGGLTNKEQFYVYITGDRSTWMGDLVESMGGALTDSPFSVFALPGAHDSGMFDPTCVAQMLDSVDFLGALAPAIGWENSALQLLGSSAILRSVINLSFTQKDNIKEMLNLGVRYFDVRPGYCYENLRPGIYHQHNFIPGYPYSSFLQDVLIWLENHPTEIVVVSANFQGFASSSMEPTVDVLQETLSAAQQSTDSTVVIADKSDLSTSYSQLLGAQKRLIFLNQVGAPDHAIKYDSYTEAYTTTNVNAIIHALNGMNRAGQFGSDYTVLQLQGTATGTGGGIFTSIVTMSDASSPLMSTKPGFDNQTYPWIQANAAQNLSPTQLLVFLNDFCDNALASYASEITRARAGACS